MTISPLNRISSLNIVAESGDFGSLSPLDFQIPKEDMMEDELLLEIAKVVLDELKPCLEDAQEVAANGALDAKNYGDASSYGYCSWVYGTIRLKGLVDPDQGWLSENAEKFSFDFPPEWPAGDTSFEVGSGNSGVLIVRGFGLETSAGNPIQIYPHRIASDANENVWDSFPRGGRRAARDHSDFLDCAEAVEELYGVGGDSSCHDEDAPSAAASVSALSTMADMEDAILEEVEAEIVNAYQGEFGFEAVGDTSDSEEQEEEEKKPRVLVLGWVSNVDEGMSELFLCEIGDTENRKIKSWNKVCLVWSRQAEEENEPFPAIVGISGEQFEFEFSHDENVTVDPTAFLVEVVDVTSKIVSSDPDVEEDISDG